MADLWWSKKPISPKHASAVEDRRGSSLLFELLRKDPDVPGAVERDTAHSQAVECFPENEACREHQESFLALQNAARRHGKTELDLSPEAFNKRDEQDWIDWRAGGSGALHPDDAREYTDFEQGGDVTLPDGVKSSYGEVLRGIRGSR